MTPLGQQRFKALIKEIKSCGEEIYILSKINHKKNHLVCHISLQGLVNNLLAKHSYSTALANLRVQYGIYRVAKDLVVCLDKRSKFYYTIASIPKESS